MKLELRKSMILDPLEDMPLPPDSIAGARVFAKCRSLDPLEVCRTLAEAPPSQGA
jgi:hypothetical protein